MRCPSARRAPAAAPGRPPGACPARHRTSPTRRPAMAWRVVSGWWLVTGGWRLASGYGEGIAACLRRREHRWLSGSEDGTVREAWRRRGAGRSGHLGGGEEGTGASTRRARRLQALEVQPGVRQPGVPGAGRHHVGRGGRHHVGGARHDVGRGARHPVAADGCRCRPPCEGCRCRPPCEKTCYNALCWPTSHAISRW